MLGSRVLNFYLEVPFSPCSSLCEQREMQYDITRVMGWESGVLGYISGLRHLRT